MTDREDLRAWLHHHPRRPGPDVVDRILRYADMLADESGRSGVISRNDRERIGMRHIRECLAPELIDRVEGRRVLDIGSGGGLPGIPLAVVGVGPVTLVEPRGRRVSFLERVLIQLGLANAHVLEATLEEIAANPPEELWEVAMARSVGWTERMARALGRILIPSAELIRFGAPDVSSVGVERVPIEAEAPRALHLWPRETWDRLA